MPIEQIAEACGLRADEEIEPYGRYKAKIALAVLDRLPDRPDGKLVCVTGMTPTKAGEGKTTTLGRPHPGPRPRSASARSPACASRRSARCSASRAARPAAA